MPLTHSADAILSDRRYEAVLLPAAMRSPRHVAALAGADMILSIHPAIQARIRAADPPREPGIATPVPPDVIGRLMAIPEFARAYEPDGMAPEEFITFGLTQRTLTQFAEAGWKPLAQPGTIGRLRERAASAGTP